MSWDNYNPPPSPKCPRCGECSMYTDGHPYPWRLHWTFVCGCGGNRTFVNVPVEGEAKKYSADELKEKLRQI